MNALDWVLLAIGLFCLGRGLMRGAVSQIFGIAGILAGFVLASHYYDPLGAQLGRSFPNLSGPQVVSFIVLFFLTWFCVGVVGFMISRLLHRTGLGCLDRVWGGAIGLGKAVALAMCIISVLTFFLSVQNPVLRDSVLAPYVQGVALVVMKATPAKVQTLFEQKQGELKRYWTEHGGDALAPKNLPPAKKERTTDNDKRSK